MGTAGLVGIAAMLIYFLAAGAVFQSVVVAAGFLYMLWSTYDTFVLHQCWTLYLKVVE
jgi:hypothetical protein